MWFLEFALITAAIVVAPKGVSGLQEIDDGSRPFSPEHVVEVELDHRGRRIQGNDLSVDSTSGCGLCRGLNGAEVLKDTFPVRQQTTDNPDDLPNGMSCEELELRSAIFPYDTTECIGFQSDFRSQCCALADSTVPSYQCEQNVQSALLGTDSGYNANVAPIPKGKFSLDIPISLRYFHISDLSITKGTADLNLAIITTWVDERLRWDPAEHGGCFQTTVRASTDVEKTQIWVPGFDLVNKVKGLGSISEVVATLHADGSVNWFRLGGLEVLCAFTGIERFPYDTLGCYLDFGSLDKRLHYKLGNFEDDDDKDDSIIISDQYQTKYKEYAVVRERVSAEHLFGGVLRYQFYFKRAHQFYTREMVVPTILFTLLSFGMFLLDLRVGERLAFGVSLLLVIIAQGILTAGILPICPERLWIEQLTSSSLFWVVGALAESILVAHFFYMETRDQERLRHLANSKRAPDERAQEGSRSLEAIEDKQETDEADDPVPQTQLFRRSAVRKLPSSSSVRQKQTDTWRRKTIRNLDGACLIIFPVTYIIFIIVMFARNQYWA